MNTELSAGIYRHYSGLLIQLLGVAEQTETKEALVVYITLSPKAVNHLRARPLDMFLENVDVDGVSVPRFTFLGYSVPKEEQDIERDALGQYV
jgi:hypothetical protein